MGVRTIGVKIVGTNASLDKRIADAKKMIRDFAKEVETGQRGATKAMGETDKATAKLGATAEKTAQKTRTSSKQTADSLGKVGTAAKKSADETDRSAKSLTRLGAGGAASVAKVSAAIGLGAVGTALLAREIATAFTAGIQLSARFEAQMRNVNSITGMTDAALGGLSQSVLDLSKELPQNATNLASGLYDIASSGFQGAEGLQVLEASARAATAGISNTATAGAAISGVLNAYGLSAASAKDVSDTLFQTVNLGVLSFDALGQGIGQVIGTAAAANVSIDQVGQAIATITKAGIKPAEAFTALNQMMAQMIQPGDALAGVFESLGYESGASALATKGLNGVMADLQRVTGGNVTTMSALFTDIRGLKGALALTSDQGRLYTGVIADWSAAHEGAGATATALAEQMKAASAQWQLVVNAIQAGTIEVGLKLLPVLTTLMGSMMDLAHGAMPDLQAGVRALTPLFNALWAIGVDVVTMLKTIGDVAAPAVGALAGLAGGAVVTGLTAIASALAAATGYAADHKDIVLLLAAVYAASLLPSLAAVQIAFNRMILTPVILGLVGVISAAEGGAVALRALAASMLTVQAVATLGLGAALFVAARGFMAMQEQAAAAKAEFEGMGTTTDVLDPAKLQSGVDALTKTAQRAADVGKEYTGTLGVIKLGAGEMFGDGQLGKIAHDGLEAANALGVLRERSGNAAANLADLRDKTGLTDAALIKLAKGQDIDLTKAPKDAADEMLKLTSYVRDLEKQTGLSTKGMAANIGQDIDAMAAFAAALKDAQDKASKAFKGGTDVLGQYDPKAGADKVVAANDKLASSQQNLSDVEARVGAKKKRTISDTQALAKAQKDVAKAQKDVTDAQAQTGTAGLKNTYKTTIAEATQFSKDITTATAKGLDAGVIARLLEQGPKQAGPVLATILSDHSGKMIKLVNDSEAQLSRLNLIVVAQARLTAIAVGSATDHAVKDLPIAMQIQQATLVDKGKLTIEQLAKKLHVSVADIRRISDASTGFGIDIVNGLKPSDAAVSTLQNRLNAGIRGEIIVDATAAIPVIDGVLYALRGIDGSTATATVNVVANFGKGLEGYPGKAADDKTTTATPFWIPKPKWGGADGGVVPGTYLGPKVDNVTIRANPREYLQSVAAHDFYGTDFMDAINARRLPRYADGGALGSRVASPWGGGAVQVVKVPIHETRTSEFPLHIEHAHFRDQADARKSYEQTRLARLGGRRPS